MRAAAIAFCGALALASGPAVADFTGRVVGVVTSCAVDAEGFLTGQAILEMKGVSSYSEGNEPNRKVVISPE
mgnify:CR=1 FL=1